MISTAGEAPRQVLHDSRVDFAYVQNRDRFLIRRKGVGGLQVDVVTGRTQAKPMNRLSEGTFRGRSEVGIAGEIVKFGVDRIQEG